MKCVNKYVLIFLTIPLSFLYAQEDKNTFITYSSGEIEYHEIVIKNSKLLVKTPPKYRLGSERVIIFDIKKHSDTLHLKKIKIKKVEEIKIKGQDKLFNRFNGNAIIFESENKLLLSKFNQPYFRKAFVDSLIGNEPIYVINRKIYHIKRDSIFLKNLSSKKVKIKEVYILKGEVAYEKYGVMSLNGVVEIKAKFRKRKNE